MDGLVEFPKWTKVLISQAESRNKNCVRDIAISEDITYSHLSGILKILRNYGLVEYQKKIGRKTFVILTPTGKEVGLLLKRVINLVVGEEKIK
jgi:DNA-binding MarR family transcriptional regulator